MDPADDDRLEREKLEALAEFAAGAGHEINNPVATIVGRVQMLLEGEADEDRRQQLITIGAQALRIRDMIGDLMLFARPPQPRRARLDLAAWTRQVLQPLESEITQKQVTLNYEPGTAEVTNGDKTILLTENQSTYIPLGQVHRLANPGKVPLEIIEVQSGAYLGEDDIVRFEDKYGRTPA